jgi:prepilin-type N-terminal cleavage/methylation domain-containing protein
MDAYPPPFKNGFTLLELLASIVVFVLLILFVTQLMNNVSSVANASKSRLDSDDQARLVMDRIAQDFSQMAKRQDLDYEFCKSTTGNDRFFFFWETAGYPATGASNLSDMALVGYRVNTISGNANYNKLERYADAMQWDVSGTGGMVFLTYPAGAANCAPLAATLLSANSATSATATDSSYHVLSDDIFRIEFCYQLKDGTYSTEPILFTKPADWCDGTFYTTAENAPTNLNGFPTYSIGSRWYDTSAKRGYICTTSGSSNLAVWRFIGWKDVSAIVVTIATIDTANRAFRNTSELHTGHLPHGPGELLQFRHVQQQRLPHDIQYHHKHHQRGNGPHVY